MSIDLIIYFDSFSTGLSYLKFEAHEFNVPTKK